MTQAITKVERERMTLEQGEAIIHKHLDKTQLKESNLAELRRALRDHPHLWRTIGDIGLQARLALIAQFGSQPAAHEAIRHGTVVLQSDLGYDAATPLEKLLIEQVITCWLNVYSVQRYYTAYTAGGHSNSTGVYWEKRLLAAQRRYLRAIESLARVRRLSRPLPLQVNIGAQQINTVTP